MSAAYIAEVEIHPAAQLFPEMTHEELLELIESVKRRGIMDPIVFYDGKLLDGRNRVRAANIAGIPTAKIPMRTLRSDFDPYQHAWDHNCNRLHYTKEQKAALHARVLAESGKWAALRHEAEESARERKKGNQNAAKTTTANMAVDVSKKKKEDPRKRNTAAKAAAKAGVSQRTYERGMAKAGVSQRKPRKAGKSKFWRLPRSIEALASVLRQKLPSGELALLISLLSGSQ